MSPTGSTFFIPDVFVFPVAYVTPRLRRDDVLEVYDRPYLWLLRFGLASLATPT